MGDTDKSMSKLIRWVALAFVTLIALYLCWTMLQPFIGVLMWATVLVIVFYPIHKRIEARTGSPGWSAVLSCLLVIITILVPLTLLMLAVYREVSGFAQSLQSGIGSLLDPNSPATGRYLRWLGQYVDIEQLRSLLGQNGEAEQMRSQEFIAERVRALSGAIANRALGLVGGAVGVIVEIFFVIFTMYYLFRDGDRMRAALRSALPLEESKSKEIFERTRDVISASVYGVLVIAVIQGVLGGLAFWLLGLPSPLLWGVVMIFLSMIPMAGAFIVWVPAALYLGLTGHWGKAAILTGWGLFAIGTVDNFLRPKLVGEKTRLHELLIFFSVLGGLQVFGVLGLVLGPVIVAVTLALIDVFRHADTPVSPTGDTHTLVEQQADLRDVPGSSSSTVST